MEITKAEHKALMRLKHQGGVQGIYAYFEGCAGDGGYNSITFDGTIQAYPAFNEDEQTTRNLLEEFLNSHPQIDFDDPGCRGMVKIILDDPEEGICMDVDIEEPFEVFGLPSWKSTFSERITLEFKDDKALELGG